VIGGLAVPEIDPGGSRPALGQPHEPLVDVHPSVLATAERVLTPRQLNVYELRLRGFGYRRISYALGISTKTVEEHVMASERKMRRAGIRLGRLDDAFGAS
jgi:DNA-binding NarL/FixJ family response regulator